MKKHLNPTLFALVFSLIGTQLHAQCTASITSNRSNPTCSGDTVTLTASTTGTGAVSLKWSTGETTSSIKVTQSAIYTITAIVGTCTTNARKVVLIADYVYKDSIVATDADQTGRLTRNGTASTCAGKTCPGANTTVGTRDYDSYFFSNNSSNAVCATIGMMQNCGGNSIFAAAYSSYSPTSLCTNYMGDMGLSSTDTQFFSVTVPANSNFYVIVSSINVTGSTGTCKNYTLWVDLPRTRVSIDTFGGNCYKEKFAFTNPSAVAYKWSTGQTSQTIEVPNSGNFKVVSTFGNQGCKDSATRNITVFPLPQLNITGGGVFCQETAPLLTATGASTYLWSNGVTKDTNRVNTSGNYTVTGTSSNGCKLDKKVKVILADYAISDSITASDNDVNGRITRDANPSKCSSSKTCPGVFTTSGVRDYDIHTFSNMTATSVCAKIALGTACVGSNAIFGAVYSALNTNDLCSGYIGDLGSSPLNDTGFFEVNVAAFSSISVVVSAVGTGASCKGYNLWVEMPRAANKIDTNTQNCLYSKTATAPYGANNYLWSTGKTSIGISVPSSGLYTVQMKFGNHGCTNSASANITVLPLPNLTVSKGGVYCANTPAGLKAIGGNSYTWNTTETTDSITITQSGQYTVTATNQFGCLKSASRVVIIGDYAFTDSIKASDLDVTGRITRDGNASTCGTAKTCPGVFSIIGTRDYDIYTITNPYASSVCANITVGTICGDINSIFASAYSNFNPSSLCSGYLADLGTSSNADTTFFSFNIPASSSIKLVISAINTGGSCGKYSVWVNIPRPVLKLTVSPLQTFCGPKGSTTMSVNNTQPSTLLWSTGANTSSITAKDTGIYTVLASYGNRGCSSTQQFRIISDRPDVEIAPANAVSCNGSPVVLKASGKIKPGTLFIWSNGGGIKDSATFTPSANTTYSLFASYNNCVDTSTRLVKLATSSSASRKDSICFGGKFIFGSKTLETAGTYQRVIPNAAGCDSTINLNLFVRPALQPTVVQNGNLLSTQTFKTYQWQFNRTDLPGENKQQTTPNNSGKFRVYVSDNHACVDTSAEFTVVMASTVRFGNMQVQVFPNPTDGLLNLRTDFAQNLHYTLHDMQGKEILCGDFTQETQLNLTAFAPGIYNVSLTDETGHSHTFRIIRNR